MISLESYKSQTTSISVVSHLVTAVSTSIIWYATAYIFDTPKELALVMGLAIGSLIGILFALTLRQVITKPVEILVQAIMHASKEHLDINPPDPSKGLYGKKFLTQAVITINDIQSVEDKSHKQLKREHDYMETLLNAAPMPILVLGHEQNIRYFNQTAKNLMSDKIEKKIDQKFGDMFNLAFSEDHTFSDWISKVQQVGLNETETWDRVKLTLPDNTVKMFDMVATYRKDDLNGIELLVMLFDHDKLYMQEADEVSFVSLAAHELRGPITVLRGYIEVFEDELGPKLDAEQKDFMKKMDISAAQLVTFVNNILNASQLDNEQLKIHMAKEDWTTTLREIVDDFKLRAEVRNRKLSLDLPANLPLVAVDKIGIYEVLGNLIDNAIKYSHDGGLVQINSVVKGNEVETTVTDHGIGINRAVVSKLFQKFYRSHRSRESVGGTGLGLYLAKAVVEAHGGQIWVRSKEGEGTTFGFTLPTYDSVADKIDANENMEITRGAHGWIKNHSFYRR